MKNKVVVISVDAMITSDLAVLKTMPELEPLFARCAQVNRMLCVFPSLTYPCHVTMITGCHPARHGICNNEEFVPGKPDPDWYWFSKSTKVPSIFTFARKAGLTTASVSWPSTAGNPDVDYLISKIWVPDAYADDEVNSLAVKDIYDRHKYLLEGHRTEDIDTFTLRCTTDIIKEFKPDLTLTYYAQIDSERHKKGVSTALHIDALHEIGRKISSIIDATREADVFEQTTFVLMADHGQIDNKAVFNLNVEFAERGLIELDDKGGILDWRMYSHSCAFSSQIYTRNICEREAYDILTEIHKEHPELLDRILTRFECRMLYHTDGPFTFMVEGPMGISFGRETVGPLVTPAGKSDYKTAMATHGHSPERGDKPPFLILGQKANSGMIIDEASLVDAAPTILGLFGIGMEDADGKVLETLISKGDR